MKITFLGATGTVTGSKYLLTFGGRSVLVDCGLFQGYKQLRLRNREPLRFDPHELDAVILTHAHIDHSGYLPLLVKQGFAGDVICTQGTRDLCEILLPDAGYLQEEEARYAERHGYSKHHPPLPLYTREDAIASLRQLRPVEFDLPIDLAGGLKVQFLEAGHILGAAIVRVEHDGKTTVFSGDLGRPNDPIMVAPATVTEADYLVVESTYGERIHDPSDPVDTLARIINETAQRGGVLLVPAFAVGRTQSLLYYIGRLEEEGRIPDLPVYLDSPMAVNATSIYARHEHEHRLSADEYERLFSRVSYINSVEASKALSQRDGPMIVVSASGMATGGRVLHHMAAFAPDPKNTILFAGYQAGGTRGAALVSGADSVKIHGEYVPVRARVEALNNLSAHADSVEILEWLGHFERPPRTTFITHGEPSASDVLRLRIQDRLGWSCVVPDHGERFSLE
jgi:metallo-beta-lactamase family protein